ncbi:MAG: cupredoxin domain-containing protein [Acidimicrobiia bacterium]
MPAFAAGGAPAGAQAAPAAEVALKGLKFEPPEVTVEAGGLVRWVWQEEVDHNVTGDGFASSTQNTGTFEYTFAQSGSYPYMCTIHGSNMAGTVTVN